ncbi:MAG: RNA polymerase-binding protein DksA [Deltaproteobacteria bacterium]|nr:RNA polymerase-binding protein DksA [bacterium]MCB9480185.1 RNA polymerase-binding protein DksA [Deltaproteobacteria bacterium]MCB9489099.1 RNA polymerase-binding protein DksA [Deltaproteobacteria bacterium]
MSELTAKELEHFRALLNEKRDEILNKARHTLDEGSLSGGMEGDEADQANHASQAALAWRLLDKDRKLLKEIEHAIDKFETGEFGYCEGTGKLIDKRRLELRPWTRYSVEYKSALERDKKVAKARGGTKIDTLF